MPDSSSAITNIQKLIKQLQKDALQQIQKTHAEPLSKVHQIMRENGLTLEMVALSFKARKQRSKKTEAEARPILKLPAVQK